LDEAKRGMDGAGVQRQSLGTRIEDLRDKIANRVGSGEERILTQEEFPSRPAIGRFLLRRDILALNHQAKLHIPTMAVDGH
jgi:hypothetical protein